MQDVFAIGLFVVVAIAAVGAIVALAVSGRAYEDIGRGGTELDATPPSTSGFAPAERDEEIRQLLTARNARRVARGEAAVDVDAELRALTAPAPAADAELREEVRSLVIARNARRAARGEAALDVEAEVERRLGELRG